MIVLAQINNFAEQSCGIRWFAHAVYTYLPIRATAYLSFLTY